MQTADFKKARKTLGKTQKNLAQILCVSTKAIQSFEQGWRNVPAHVEREMLLLLALKTNNNKTVQPCWKTKNCPAEWRVKCIVWELKAGNLCWFLSGTHCRGKVHECWEDKLHICRSCSVYRSMFDVN